MILLRTFIIILLMCTSASATDYWVSALGSDTADGLTEESAWATFAYADSQVSAGDVVTIADGTYSETMELSTSGSLGNPITWQAETRQQVIIQKTTDGEGLLIYSPSGSPRSYITIDGIHFRSHGEYNAIDIGSYDNVDEVGMSNNIVIKNCSTFGSANLTNTMSWKMSRVRDCLVEDSWAYGFGRKAFQLYGSLRVTVRRFVARYDYWSGAGYKPNDPRIGFAVYNSQDGIYENIIVMDNAPDPTGTTSASKAGFALEGNVSSTALLLGASGNKMLGLIGIGNDYNNFYSSGVSTGQNNDNIIKDCVFWDAARSNGIALQQESSNNTLSYITLGSNAGTGLRINSSTVDSNSLLNMVAINNTGYGLYTAYDANITITDTTKYGNSDADLEASYVPTFDYLPRPTMVTGHERGGTIEKRYVDGVLTSTNLFPWVNEDLIKSQMCSSTDLSSTNRVSANGDRWEPVWCASGKGLTEYIWEYTGNECPVDVCGGESGGTGSPLGGNSRFNIGGNSSIIFN